MSYAGNICNVHLVQTIPRKTGMLFCQLLLKSSMNLDGPRYNTSTLFDLSLDRFVFALMNIVIEQFYSSPLYLQKDQLSVTSGLLPSDLWFSSTWYCQSIFLISNLLGKCIASLILSHLPPLSMAWNKTGTREAILKVSSSRTLTLARSVADRMGRAPPALQRIPIPRRQKTGKHPWMKGDFNQAQNVPLKKQQTLLTYNSVKQKSNHLYHQNIYQIISHTHSTEVNLTLHEIHRPKESKTTWGSGNNNTPIQQLRIFQWTFMWQMRFLKNTVSSNKYLTKTHFVLLGDVNWLPSET